MAVPVVLCPLQLERRAAVRAVGSRAMVRAVGPGSQGVQRAVQELKSGGVTPPLVVLFGLAGGLRESLIAPRVGWVSDRGARSWRASCLPPGEDEPVGLLGSPEPITDPARKAQLGQAFGTALVDCESHAFAEAAQAAGLTWAVVRGVSDRVDEALPADAADWIDDRGRTRVLALAGKLLVRPNLIPAVLTLGLRSGPALKVAAGRLVELLEAFRRDPASVAGPDRLKPSVRVSLDRSRDIDTTRPSTPIEEQLGRRSARLNDPPGAAPPRRPR